MSAGVFPPDDLLGRQLDEYRLERLLGRGGMARVYLGLDVRLNRYAAIKVIDLPLREQPEYLRRFEREAQAVAQLEHPNIVRLYRYGEADGLLYMAMQYVPGADLATVLASYQADGELIEPAEACRLAREIGLALDYAHGCGVIHRDLKPSNIMLDRGGHAVLTDFGLALLTVAGTRGEILGSPHYIAPEQALSSARAVPQSDLYALGVMLYEMFTGRLPFDSGSALDVALLHIEQAPPPPRSVRPALSPAVGAVILKALAKQPAERYPSGAALAAALERALQAAPGAEPETPPTSPRRTIPDRVLLELAQRRPVPPLPAAGEPAAPREAGRPPVGAPTGSLLPSASPSTPRRTDPLVLAGAGAGALTLLAIVSACLLVVFGVWLNRPQPAAVADVSATAPATDAATDAATNAEGGAPAATATTAPPATATNAPAPAATAAEAAAPSATAPPAAPELRLVRVEDALVVANLGELPVALGPLRLGDGDEAVDGGDWGVDELQPQSCVTLWNRRASEADTVALNQAGAAGCVVVGERLTRSGRDRFWRNTFTVRYAGERIAECDEDWRVCVAAIGE